MPVYDLGFDAGLIEASFAAQYGIRLAREAEMTWREFAALMSGLGADTPLGLAVAIRSEKDARRVAAFSAGQRRVYDEWRAFCRKEEGGEQREEGDIGALQRALAARFGGV